MATLADLNHAYNRGYLDGRRGNPELTAAWQGDELGQYRQGYKKGASTRQGDTP